MLDTSGYVATKNAQEFVCIYGEEKLPLCPFHLCVSGSECQLCEGFIKPTRLKITEDDLFSQGLIEDKYESEKYSNDVPYKQNFYTEFYTGTKEALVASYEIIASYFGFAEEVEFGGK